MQPLPETPYDLAVWKQAKLHRDCYVVFDNAYYSAPFRLVGQQLRVRGGGQEVRLYTSDYQLVATHERATEPGQRMTNPAHLPPDKLPGLVLDRAACQAVAADIGLATTALVGRLLAYRWSTVSRWCAVCCGCGNKLVMTGWKRLVIAPCALMKSATRQSSRF